jgi:hypothetical protein
MYRVLSPIDCESFLFYSPQHLIPSIYYLFIDSLGKNQLNEFRLRNENGKNGINMFLFYL